MLATRIERINRHRRRHVILQERHQAPRAHLRADDERRLEHDARASRGGLREQIAVIGMQAAGNAHRVLRAGAIAKAPDMPRADVFVGEAVVPRQLFRGLRRAMLRQILRRGARHEPRLAELARHQIVRAGRADADRQIEALLDQIDHAIGERHIEAHLWMTREKFGDRRRDMVHAEIYRGGEPDGAARHYRRARSLLLCLGEIGEQLHRALVEGAAALRQAYAPRGAIEKARLQMTLELGDMPGRGGGRQAQAVRRPGEAARFKDLGEDLNGAEAVHAGRYYPAFWNNVLLSKAFIPRSDRSTLPSMQLAATAVIQALS